MTRSDPPTTGDQLLHALRDPAGFATLPPATRDGVIRAARQLGVLGTLAARCDGEHLSPRTRELFRGALTVAEESGRMLDWEVDRIGRALAGSGVEVILLKGAAYRWAGLRAARGRSSGDVDILVARSALPLVESRLHAHGWEEVKPDPHDQRFYREWMHELPPLRHRERRTWVDVHHALLPVTSRLHPDSDELLAAARRVAGGEWRVLMPVDLVLHAAVHLAYDGDFSRGLREVCDLDALLSELATAPGFWEELQTRAGALELQLPLYYGLELCRRLLGTPVPELREPGVAGGWLRRWMVWLALRVITSPTPRPVAAWLLYVRSHWLRLPPHWLIHHLGYKGWVRLRGGRTG